METIKENIKLNEKIINKSKIFVTNIDFNSKEIVSQPNFLHSGVDIIIGSEVCYYPEVAELLCGCINLYLKKNGIFYGISPAYRKQGNKTFIDGMEKLNFIVSNQLPNWNILKNDIGDEMSFFVCKRK